MSQQDEGIYENADATSLHVARRDEGSDVSGGLASGWVALLCGMAAGALLMYLLDPDRGRRRRALLRDKAVGWSNDFAEAATGTARDLRNRAQGLVAEAGGALGLTGRGAANEESSSEQQEGQESTHQRAANA